MTNTIANRQIGVNMTVITQEQALQVLDMLQNGILELITIAGMDVIYNPNMNDGEWELFDHNDDHTEYSEYNDIYECSEVLISLTM